MCCCCGRICMLCTCLVLVVIAIGLMFGFGVFKDGFHKIHNTIHRDNCVSDLCTTRRSYGFPVPPRRLI